MIKQSLISAALALATATLAAQAPKTTPAAPKPAAPGAKPAAPQPQNTQDRYVPAIMQEKMVTVAGCLKRNQDWELTDATIAGQKDKAAYKLEGIGDARLSLFAGKRVQATGALQNGGKATGKNLPRFEATAVQEATGSCP